MRFCLIALGRRRIFRQARAAAGGNGSYGKNLNHG